MAACELGCGAFGGSTLVGTALPMVGAGFSMDSTGETAALGRVGGSRTATAGEPARARSLFGGGSGTSGMIDPPREP
jgi:hypothetical protein